MFGRVVNISYFCTKFSPDDNHSLNPKGNTPLPKENALTAKKIPPIKKGRLLLVRRIFLLIGKKATTGREKTPYRKEKPSYSKEKSAEYSPTTRAPYKRNTPKPNATDQSKGIRLNKYIAKCGNLCPPRSRSLHSRWKCRGQWQTYD